MKKAVIIFSAALLAAVCSTAAVLQRQQQDLSQKLVRLHVVANSDTAEDQALKLLVRDAVLDVTEAAADLQELCALLPQVERAARACLDENGSDDAVCVTLQKENFPTRAYETFSLPAGTYTALRVTVGAGEGHNWWCVAFPAICMCAVSEFEEAAQTAGFTDGEVKLITEENEGYVLKFKVLELLQEFKEQVWK